jgi:hypothetical protein
LNPNPAWLKPAGFFVFYLIRQGGCH